LDNFEDGEETVSDKTSMVELLQAFALGEDQCLFIPEFEQSGLMKVSDWRHNREMMPGDEMIKKRRDKLKGSHLPFDCLDDIERYNKQVIKTDFGYEIMADGHTLNIKPMMKKVVADQKKLIFAPVLSDVA